MMSDQDSVYARRPWNSLPENIVDNALDYYTRPSNEIAMTRPPIPNIGKTAPRFGYQRQPLGITDIAHLDEIYPRRIDYTGQQADFSGTITPALGVM